MTKRPTNEQTAEPTEALIERWYTQRILNGNLPPGSRLPPNQELAVAWKTSCTAVQRALSGLTALGLLERKQRKGTFVRSSQQRALIGILFGPDLTDEASSSYRSLCKSLQNVIDSEFLSSRVYDGLNRTYNERNINEFEARRKAQARHLKIDRRFNTFTGFLHIAVAQVPSADCPSDLPFVLFDQTLPETDIIFDYRHFGREMTRTFHSQGMKKLWIVKSHKKSSSGDTEIKAIRSEAAALGMLAPTLIRIPTKHSGYLIEKEAHDYLMNYFSDYLRKNRNPEFPDGIIICDDITARATVLSLLEYGIKVPEQVRLGVLATENTHIYYPVPVSRFYIPASKISETMFDLLKKRIAGHATPATPISLQGWLTQEH